LEKNRLEAFSDGVIAIILTIMVLDLKVPKESTVEAMLAQWPVFIAYAMSYAIVFMLWLNHHQLFASLEKINHSMLMRNGLVLFAMSFIPFVTAYAGESKWSEPLAVSLYGLVMAAVSLGFVRLRLAAIACAQNERDAVNHKVEFELGMILIAAFLAGAACAWYVPRWALIIYVLASLLRQLHRRSVNKGQ